MLPLTIGVSIQTQQLRAEMEAALRDLPVRIVIDEPEIAAFSASLEKARPDVILTDVSRRAEQPEEVVRSLYAAASGSMLIVLHLAADPEKILAAMRAGANEYLFPPLQANLRAALERKSDERSRTLAGLSRKGKCIAFVSAKGGCGSTTIACHVAAELGRRSTHHVLLADLDLHAGLISFLMRSKSPYTVVDALHNLHRLDWNYWKALCSNGYPNLEVISSPPPRWPSAPVDAEQVRHVLSFARSNYEWTVVDLGRGVTPLAMAAAEEIGEVFLVSTMDMPALHALSSLAPILAGGSYGAQHVHLILNRAPARPDTTPQELEKALGHPIFAMLPDDYRALCDAYSERRLLSANSNLARHLSRLATKIAGTPEESGKRKFSLFGRL